MKENKANGNVKERIIETAARFFSEKGHDGAKMNEIAQAAGVNKALIYYYFPAKQAILDHIIESFFNDVMNIGMDFINDTMIRMIEAGSLDIYPDRMRFSTGEDAMMFKEKAFEYYERVFEHMMKRRDALRVILSEALRSGEQRDALFRFFMMAGENNNSNPIFAAVSSADQDFNLSKEVMFRKFFFSLMPMINFVVFHEEYKKASGMSDGEMRSSYLRSIETLYAGYFVGRDIMMELGGGEPNGKDTGD